MNETIEEKKKILNTYGAAVRKYHALKNQEKHLRMIINRPRAAVLSGMPSSNKHKDISDIKNGKGSRKRNVEKVCSY